MKFNKLFIVTFLLSISFLSNAQSSDLKNLLDQAKDGSKSAMYNLGVMYSTGNGVKANKELANKFYTESASMNYSPAQNNLGWSYREGLGVPKNTAVAVYWFRLSAIQGNPLALQNLAEMYVAGEGVPKRPDVAEDLYRLCAAQRFVKSDQGNEGAYNNAIHECRRELGKLISVRSKDEQKALRTASFWFRSSLVENYELKEDTETAIRSRRATKETLDLLAKIDSKLTKQSKEWVESNLKNWDALREYIQDTTAFPLTEMDCAPEKMVL